MTQPFQKRVLVIEDDVYIRTSLQELLELEGFGVDLASNGQEGMAILQRALDSDAGLPSLLLLDLMMPVMNGWQFRLELKQNPRLAQIPLIVLSADLSIRQKAEAVEADGYLCKPVELEDLLNLLRQHCSTS